MHADLTAAWAILALALLMDGTVGEYPAALHPVVWIGHSIATGLRLAPASGWWRQFFFGALLTLLIAACSAGLTWLLLWSVASYPLIGILAGAILLKASFALRELGRGCRARPRGFGRGQPDEGTPGGSARCAAVIQAS